MAVSDIDIVELDRRFVALGEQGWPDAEIDDFASYPTRFVLSWDELLCKRRVVVLAEAGSGKTTELSDRTRLQREAGRFAFYAAAQDIGGEGLEAALGPDGKSLAEWRSSDKPA